MNFTLEGSKIPPHGYFDGEALDRFDIILSFFGRAKHPTQSNSKLWAAFLFRVN